MKVVLRRCPYIALSVPSTIAFGMRATRGDGFQVYSCMFAYFYESNVSFFVIIKTYVLVHLPLRETPGPSPPGVAFPSLPPTLFSHATRLVVFPLPEGQRGLSLSLSFLTPGAVQWHPFPTSFPSVALKCLPQLSEPCMV